MSDVWGLMPKSQEDAETIEQAVVRIVAEHNADSVAHTATGQSIDVHRTNSIIDHPHNSIVVDKISAVKPAGFNALSNLARWNKAGYVDTEFLSGVHVGLETGASTTAYMWAYPGYDLVTSDLSKSFSISFDLSFAGYTEGFLGHFGIMPAGYSWNRGVYLEVTNTYTKLVAQNDTETLQTSDLAINWGDEMRRNIQIIYSGVDGGLYIYIDGVQAGTLAVPTGGFVTTAECIRFYMNDTVYNEYTAYIDNLVYGVF